MFAKYKRYKRQRDFLRVLYKLDKADNSTKKSLWKIGNILKWNHSQAGEVADALNTFGFIKIDNIGVNYTTKEEGPLFVEMTPKGYEEIETWIIFGYLSKNSEIVAIIISIISLIISIAAIIVSIVK